MQLSTGRGSGRTHAELLLTLAERQQHHRQDSRHQTAVAPTKPEKLGAARPGCGMQCKLEVPQNPAQNMIKLESIVLVLPVLMLKAA